MGRRRGIKAILAGAGALAAAVLAAGCGPETHANDPRPALPIEVTVNITDHAIQVQPDSIGTSRDDSTPISQNEGVPKLENSSDEPAVVVFTSANTTETDTALEIRGAEEDMHSGPIVAHGNNSYKVALATGDYVIEAADIPAAEPADFTVGPLRISSQNDLLLP
ncbi:MAG: hypothetical protein AABM29_10270 [Actinomycetota bacterium]